MPADDGGMETFKVHCPLPDGATAADYLHAYFVRLDEDAAEQRYEPIGHDANEDGGRQLPPMDASA